MIAPAELDCTHPEAKKHGKDRDGNQRMRCKSCGSTWILKSPRPLGDMRIDQAKAVLVLRMLLEGMSIRATERLTGTHRDTICDLVATVGANCKRFLEKTMDSVPAAEVECDEIWGFVGMKEKTRQRLDASEEFGDCYTYVAMERNTKLVLTWLCAKRCSDATWDFAQNLREATSGRLQVSTDGYGPYQLAVPYAFDFQVDYARIVKTYGGTSDVDGNRRYSPANIVRVEKSHGCGNPDLNRTSTSHSERLNLSIRMQNRRMTRLTNAHSKKWANHEAMLAIYFAYYNYCRKHATLKATPAMASGLAKHVWSIDELLVASSRSV